MSNHLRKIDSDATRFFFKYAGYGIPPGRAECARQLARAEQYASDHGWRCAWQDDDEPCFFCDDSNLDDGRCCCCGREPGNHHHNTIEGCVLLDADSEHLASLCAITDATHEYRRVVEAELASEVLGAIERAAASDKEAERIMAL